ncbi:MAG: glycoside hydrolase family 3 C-terminal domain-containing protein, partial [Turicibacter sp.]
LTVIFKFNDQRIEGEFSREHHHELAVKIEEECIVLLKNEEILPLNQTQKVAFIGEFAQKPRFQGGGSSHINASIIESALDSIDGKMDVTYASGYTTDADIVDEALILEAINVAKSAQVAVLFIGLPDSFESEGYDRKHLRLPDCQNKLVEAVCAVQPNTVVVLHNGSPVEMPWVDSVKGIVEVYLGGEGVGKATVNVLLGAVNPSGKLAETFPLKLEDNPSYLNFPGTKDVVEYREGVFVGYRYYDTKKLPVLFPFGHGLSYTTFAFENLKLSHESLLDSETLQVSVDVTNTGTRAGKEVVQIYVKDHTGVTMRPEKELKNFVKVNLLPGETKTVTLTLDKRAFAYYNTEINDWYCGTGVYEVMIGQSSQNIILSQTVTVISSTVLPMVVTPNTTVGDLMKDPRTAAYVQTLFPKPTMNGNADEAISDAMIAAMVENFPLRAARGFAGVTNEQLNGMIAMLNQILEN